MVAELEKIEKMMHKIQSRTRTMWLLHPTVKPTQNPAYHRGQPQCSTTPPVVYVYF